MSRCPECGQKECCGADMAAKLDRYREALEKIAAIENRYNCGDWDEIQDARDIANEALRK